MDRESTGEGFMIVYRASGIQMLRSFEINERSFIRTEMKEFGRKDIELEL
jgi:hypothetical protein